MSISNYILNLLDLKDENIEIFENVEKIKKKNISYNLIFGRLTYNASVCPVCGNVHSPSIIKHGTKSSDIKLLPFNGEPTFLRLKKQRFLCKECNSTFIAETDIVKKNCFISNRVKAHITTNLTMKVSEKDVASLHYVSHSTVSKCVDQAFEQFKPNYQFLPEHLCFDEFKSTKTAKGSMSFIFCDAITHDIIDIVENRQLHYLKRYFSRFSECARESVKSICIDMYQPYISLISDLFPNAKIVFDKFHIVNHLSRALNKTRIEVMNSFSKYSMEYKRLKRYWKLIQKPYLKLNSTRFRKWIHFERWKSARDVVMDSISVNKTLLNTYDCYQILLKDVENGDIASLKAHLEYYSDEVSDAMKTSINTLLKDFEYVKNCLEVNVTNGCLEGINNFIKCLKRVAFGYRSYYHFRNRILICKKMIVPKDTVSVKKRQAANAA
ncbi:ISL3 family transposase [Microaceticoccus formicicus]|uniref:ISL3 family transposase n=1 Tax=Microaceticoccus formicicus TaxID=3118105 RepID=UPI003CD0342F|nr:ISL3 family transposase [Peptoniphilaceae bacterium AMB_02]